MYRRFKQVTKSIFRGIAILILLLVLAIFKVLGVEIDPEMYEEQV